MIGIRDHRKFLMQPNPRGNITKKSDLSIPGSTKIAQTKIEQSIK